MQPIGLTRMPYCVMYVDDVMSTWWCKCSNVDCNSSRLIDTVNVTCDDKHMWIAPFASQEKHFLKINFGKPERITLLRVWNYNKSPEDTYKGVVELFPFFMFLTLCINNCFIRNLAQIKMHIWFLCWCLFAGEESANINWWQGIISQQTRTSHQESPWQCAFWFCTRNCFGWSFTDQ